MKLNYTTNVVTLFKSQNVLPTLLLFTASDRSVMSIVEIWRQMRALRLFGSAMHCNSYLPLGSGVFVHYVQQCSTVLGYYALSFAITSTQHFNSLVIDEGTPARSAKTSSDHSVKTVSGCSVQQTLTVRLCSYQTVRFCGGCFEDASSTRDVIQGVLMKLFKGWTPCEMMNVAKAFQHEEMWLMVLDGLGRSSSRRAPFAPFYQCVRAPSPPFDQCFSAPSPPFHQCIRAPSTVFLQFRVYVFARSFILLLFCLVRVALP
ncbi:hypothetical protein LR48_Vigan04g098300 [Vigna angularis]|uniref:Uncharacterized protein n=1 Tax=Phaseolus angularis TaxID=3914 RepID=A0A0L9UCY4_PHAAN|nr:hypothetical protein LR48_Vigan04g098300 [Vigna angularis]